MATYTCITCHVAFTSPDLQREHYKTDWHRYNLKRKVVGMPPVTTAVFQEKIKEHRNQLETNKIAEGISGFACKLCQKTFGSHQAFENHRKSRKHRDRESSHLNSIQKNVLNEDVVAEKGSGEDLHEARIEKILADAKADMDQPKVIKATEAKSTNRDFASGDNPRMQWFLKQAKSLGDLESSDGDEWEDIDEEDLTEDEEQVDEDADVESLPSSAHTDSKQRRIGVDECLFCLKKSKDMESNIIHMSKHHGFFIPDISYISDLKGLLNYLGEKVGVGNICLWCNEKGKAFYSIYAVCKHMKDKGHCNMLVTGDSALEYADYYNFEYSEDEDMELDDDMDDAEQSVEECQDLELVLPSGAAIGHRSLMKYYKQKFPTVERNSTKKQRALARVISQYKALGWNDTVNASVVESRKDLTHLRKMKSKFQLKLSMRNNKTQMKHYRSQVFI